MVLMKRTVRLLPTFILIVFLLMGVMPAVGSSPPSPLSEPVVQQGPGNNPQGRGYTGLDVLFVVDHSGSMGGAPFGGDPIYGDGNDPNMMRFNIPQIFAGILGDFRGLDTRDLDVNMALLAFGDHTRLLLNWTDINDPVPGAPDPWPGLLQQIRDDIDDTRFGRVHLGFTDFKKAIAEARNLFQQAPTSPGGGQHLKVIVILTDGAPCVPVGRPIDCTNLQAVGAFQHLDELAAYVDQHFPTHYELFVIGLDRDNSYWSQVEDNWRRVVCENPQQPACDMHARRVTDEVEAVQQAYDVVTTLFREIGAGWRPPIVINPGVPFPVPPYTQLMRINVFKLVPQPLTQGVQLTKPDGSTETQVTLQRGTDDFLERYEVSSPDTGEWILNVSQDDLQNIQKIEFSAELIVAGVEANTAMTSPPYMYEKVDVTARLFEQQSGQLAQTGPTMEIEPDYPITMQAMVYDARQVNPSSTPPIDTFTFGLDPNAAIPGLSEFSYTWHPTQVGEYQIHVSAYYVDINDSAATPQYLFQNEKVIDPFEVRESYVEVVAPISSELEGRAVDVGFNVRQKGTDQLVDTGNALRLRLSWTDTVTGDQQGPVDVANAVMQPGQFLGPITITPPGMYMLTLQPGIELDTWEPLGLPYQTPLEVRPLRMITLEAAFSPSDSEVVSRENSLYPFFPKKTLGANVRIVDDEGNLVPETLEILTNTPGAKPIVRIVDDDGNTVVDLTDQLVVQPGVYSAVGEGVGAGDFRLVAEVPPDLNELVGDFVWDDTEATATQSRARNLNMYGTIVGFIAIPLLVGGVFMVMRQRRVAGKIFPLRGRFELRSRDATGYDELVQAINLDAEDTNRLVLGGRRLRGPFNKLILTTNRNEHNSENKIVVVEQLVFMGQPDRNAPYTVLPGQEFQIGMNNQDGKLYYITQLADSGQDDDLNLHTLFN